MADQACFGAQISDRLVGGRFDCDLVRAVGEETRAPAETAPTRVSPLFDEHHFLVLIVEDENVIFSNNRVAACAGFDFIIILKEKERDQGDLFL